MIAIAKTISTAIIKTYRQITAKVFGNTPRTTYECMPYGMDANPIAGMNAIYAPTTVNGLPVIIGYLNISQLADVGENRTYSTDANGVVKFYIWQKNDGTCEVGGNVDNLVRYAKLNLALQNDIVTFINTQLPLIAAGISTGGGSYTPGIMSIDITAAKINEIKTL